MFRRRAGTSPAGGCCRNGRIPRCATPAPTPRSSSPHELAVVVVAPPHVVERRCRIEAHRLPDPVGHHGVNGHTFVDLVEMRQRACAELRDPSRLRTGGLRRCSANPRRGRWPERRSLRPCWYWMPTASRPKSSAMRRAAMYIFSWRTCASVSSFSSSVPKSKRARHHRATLAPRPPRRRRRAIHLRHKALRQPLLVDPRWG